jgi:hypothetical protein
VRAHALATAGGRLSIWAPSWSLHRVEAYRAIRRREPGRRCGRGPFGNVRNPPGAVLRSCGPNGRSWPKADCLLRVICVSERTFTSAGSNGSSRPIADICVPEELLEFSAEQLSGILDRYRERKWSIASNIFRVCLHLALASISSGQSLRPTRRGNSRHASGSISRVAGRMEAEWRASSRAICTNWDATSSGLPD